MAPGEERGGDNDTHLCGVMEPDPDVTVGVGSAPGQGGHEGSLTCCEHRHQVARGPLLAGQLYEEEPKETETSPGKGQSRAR